jgi:glucokinase
MAVDQEIAVGGVLVLADLARYKLRVLEDRETARSESSAGKTLGSQGLQAKTKAPAGSTSLYGAQAGNLALTVMGIGGVYVGGGIVTKLLPKMTTGAFMNSFRAKGRYAQLMAEIPVYIILNPNTSQLGAAQATCELLD